MMLSVLALVSCNKKGCTDELANNYEEDAKKDDASCTYNWDQYLGTYTGESGECSTPDGMHIITITKGPTKDEMIISNFADLGIDIRATINGNEFSYSQTQEVVGHTWHHLDDLNEDLECTMQLVDSNAHSPLHIGACGQFSELTGIKYKS